MHHILDFFEHEVSDQIIWKFAMENYYCIVTNDQDFEELIGLFGFPPKVILLKCGNQSNSFLATYLQDQFHRITEFLNNKELGILRLY